MHNRKIIALTGGPGVRLYPVTNFIDKQLNTKDQEGRLPQDVDCFNDL
jgi:hypothetical protein